MYYPTAGVECVLLNVYNSLAYLSYFRPTILRLERYQYMKRFEIYLLIHTTISRTKTTTGFGDRRRMSSVSNYAISIRTLRGWHKQAQAIVLPPSHSLLCRRYRGEVTPLGRLYTAKSPGMRDGCEEAVSESSIIRNFGSKHFSLTSFVAYFLNGIVRYK